MQDKKLSRVLFAALSVGALVVLLVIGDSAFKWYKAYGRSQQAVFLLISFLIMAGVVCIGSWLKWGTGLSVKTFFLLLLLVSLLPRLFWVLAVRTEPFSDFLHMHNYGVAVSQGDFTHYVDFYACFPFKFGFGFLVGGLYTLFGTGHLVMPLFNVVMSLAMVILVYFIGREIFSETAARASALFCALWPAQIMYTSVVAAENSFIVPFLGAILVFVRFIKKLEAKQKPYGLLVLSGLLTAIAQAFRPLSMILLPVFGVYLLLFVSLQVKWQKSLLIKLLSIVLIAASYFISLKLISLPIKHLSGIDITKTGSGYNLLVGTNYDGDGMFNKEDFAMIAAYDFDFDRVHDEAFKLAVERITKDPARFLELVGTKIYYMWGTENYGYYWSITPASGGPLLKTIKTYPRSFYTGSDFFYLFMLLLAIVGCVFALIKRNIKTAPLFLLMGGLFVAYCFLEIQARYHFPAVPVFILLAGFGVSQITFKRTKKEKPSGEI